jgi:SET domain
MLADDWQQRLTVREADGKGLCVFATERISPGQMIGYYDGVETIADTMHTVHFEEKKIDGTGILRHLAHSCDPNANFKDKQRWLYATKDIDAGAEVTIDYLHTEPTISEPFLCKCGSPNCRGMIG